MTKDSRRRTRQAAEAAAPSGGVSPPAGRARAATARPAAAGAAAAAATATATATAAAVKGSVVRQRVALNGATKGEVPAAKRRRKESAAIDRRQRTKEEAQAKVAKELLEGPTGIEPPQRLPLRLLTAQRLVAWQLQHACGKIEYMVPIGSNAPLSPFSD
mmetsp:Transcript_40333/g.79667  ORF Transcript_40333/g.79667 Transcript_40333/m.79667 type:complete len:160 (-) Transcript_40333:101-580(-)